MKRKALGEIVLALGSALVLGLSSGCGGAKKQPQTSPIHTLPDTPTFTQVQIEQFIRPDFIDNYSNKIVQFDATYHGTFHPDPSGFLKIPALPDKYKKDFIQIVLGSPPSSKTVVVMYSAVIPISKQSMLNLKKDSLVKVVGKIIPIPAGMTAGVNKIDDVLEVQSITPY